MPVIATNHPNNNTSNMQDASYSMLFSPAASSLASTPGGLNASGFSASGGAAELEINWDPTLIKSELLQAAAVLSHRSLKLAAKWASEQMVGIPVGQPVSLQAHNDEENVDDTKPQIQSIMQEELLNMTEQDWYAKSLVEVGEYLHAAAVLSQDIIHTDSNNVDASNPGSGDITHMGPPSQGLSSYGVYLRAYALYMAGERRKEEEYASLESKSKGQKVSPRNPYLKQLVEEVSESYNNGELDAFGLYVYGLILKQAQQESI
ncbi:MAG: hypothetical protein SGARI_005869, partial [Bacillariaceae sp.]